jgi:dTDP-glucose pyrophosphorylase
MLAIIPAAGAARRLQPLPFSKELLPVGSRTHGGQERPRAVSEFVVERLLLAGASRICFVVAPRKLDIVTYYGANVGGVPIAYVIQPEPQGLCDAVFRGLAFAERDEPVVVGLPDTVWFPAACLQQLPLEQLAFLLFPVSEPERFDAVLTDDRDNVTELRVKSAEPGTSWIWGAFGGPATCLRALEQLFIARGRRDEYFGELVNAYLAGGGSAVARRAGRRYYDVGTVTGYRHAFANLDEAEQAQY